MKRNDCWHNIVSQRAFTQLFLPMKLTVLFILGFCFQSVAINGFSQQVINLDLKNSSIKKILETIEAKSDYKFVYGEELTAATPSKMDIYAKNASIDYVMEQLLATTNLSFKKLSSNLVVIIGKDITYIVSVRVKGCIVDQMGLPLSGVSIVEKGTTNGVTTDTNGEFAINVKDSTAILVITNIGYQLKEVVVAKDPNPAITLLREEQNMNEVVVVGYGTTAKKDLTGSVATVQTKELSMLANTSINQMLQGRVAGLEMSTVTAQPGGAVNVNLRGYLSQLGGNSPLYVLDGVPLTYYANSTPGLAGSLGTYDGVNQDPLSTINPSDIESISVLKDASATAIYGSSGANGVIIINTKKGRAGNITVDYRGSYTLQTPKKFYTIDDLLDGHDFMQQHEWWAKEYYLYQNKLVPYGDTDPATVNPYVPKFSQEEIDNAGPGYNYMKIVMRDNAYIMDHNISLSGGNEKTKVFSSFQYFDNNAQLIPSTYRRYSGRINLDQKIGTRITLFISSGYSYVKANNATVTGRGAEVGDMIGASLGFPPNIAPYDSAGNFSKAYIGQNPNPLSFLLFKNLSRTKRLFFAPNLEIRLLKDLKLNLTAGVDDQTGLRNLYVPIKARIPFVPDGIAQLATNTIYNQSLEGYFTFTRNFKNSLLTAVAGVGRYDSKNDGYWVQAKGFTSDAFGDDNIAAANPASTLQGSYKSTLTKLSGYYRVNYSLLNKYIFSFSGRADGSSSFAENHKWGFFPGIAAAWKISNEPFFSNAASVIDLLKLRASYGASGNDVVGANAVALYGTIPNANFIIGGTNYPAVTLLQLANSDLTWETDITFDAGVDLSFLKNRILLTYDFYIKTAKDLLSYNNLPYNNPVSIVAANVGATRSMGHEFDLTTKNIQSDGFSWSTHITASHYNTSWAKRSPQYVLQPWEKEKESLGAVFGLKTDGIIKSPEAIPAYQPGSTIGNIKYLKIDQTTDIIGTGDVVKLYDNNYRWLFGFGNTFQYKNIDLSMFIYGSLRQYGYMYQVYGDPGAVVAFYNNYNEVKDHWATFNPSGFLPGVAPDPVSNPTGITDFGLTKKGSWARIKNITLGYTLPDALMKNSKYVRSLRFFADIQNAGIISKIYKRLDPEFGYTYPPSLSSTLGVSVGFK